MVDFQLDEMQEMLRELAHEFAVDEIRPHAEHWDEESVYPKEVIQMAHEMDYSISTFQRNTVGPD